MRRKKLPNDRPVMVFIASKNTTVTKLRVLWVVTMRDAKKICSDPRTGISAHPQHMLCWFHRGVEGEDWDFIKDNGRYDDILKEHNVTILRKKAA